MNLNHPAPHLPLPMAKRRKVVPIQPIHCNGPIMNGNVNKSYQSEVTTDQFMSQPLAAFIDNEDESNFEIADKIVTYFTDRDTGCYAAIVADASSPAQYVADYIEDKMREVSNCRGKWICVWKQAKSEKLKVHYSKTVVSALVKGLTIETKGGPHRIQEHLHEVFGKHWCVVQSKTSKSSACYYHDHQDNNFTFASGGYKWSIWRNF